MDWINFSYVQGQLEWWCSSPCDHQPQRRAHGGSSKPLPRTLWFPQRDDARRFLQERDEAQALYSNAVRDLGRMNFHLNTMQDALTISENRANTIQMRLEEAEARISGEVSYGNSYLHNPDFTDF